MPTATCSGDPVIRRYATTVLLIRVPWVEKPTATFTGSLRDRKAWAGPHRPPATWSATAACSAIARRRGLPRRKCRPQNPRSHRRLAHRLPSLRRTGGTRFGSRGGSLCDAETSGLEPDTCLFRMSCLSHKPVGQAWDKRGTRDGV